MHNQEPTATAADSFYANAGVDQRREDAALARMLTWINPTLESRRGRIGEVQLPIGFFANVVSCGNDLGIAAATDSVGTKALIAQALEKYDTISIDCIAANVNDVLCVGAEPVTMLDFIALSKVNEAMLLDLARGLAEGASLADVSICGGEIAQVGSMIRGVDQERAFDLMGTCIGIVPLSKMISGRDVLPGDVIIALPSNGLHCNGVSLARTVLENRFNASLTTRIPDLGRTLGEELLMPSRIYVREVLHVLRTEARVSGLVHVSGGGLLNLIRCGTDVSYVVDQLPDVPVVFRLIQEAGRLPNSAMFHTFNMGIGFCLMARARDADAILHRLTESGISAHLIGHVIEDKEVQVYLPQYDLYGANGTFWQGCQVPT